MIQLERVRKPGIWGLGYLFSVLAGTKPVVLYIAGAQYLDPLTLRALREFAQLSPASSLGILILLEVTTESNQEIDTLEVLLKRVAVKSWLSLHSQMRTSVS